MNPSSTHLYVCVLLYLYVLVHMHTFLEMLWKMHVIMLAAFFLVHLVEIWKNIYLKILLFCDLKKYKIFQDYRELFQRKREKTVAR